MSLNWGRLVEQGRAKAYGVPWTEDELAALGLGIPAEFVRQGCLTMEDYEEVKNSAERKYAKIHELRKEAKELGVAFSRQTTRQELVELIEIAERKNMNPEEENVQAEEVAAEAEPVEEPVEEEKSEE